MSERYPDGAWGVAIWAILLGLVAAFFFIAPGDVLNQTAVGRGIPGFSDEVWNGCWLAGGLLTFAGCVRQARWVEVETFGLFLSTFAALTYFAGLSVTVLQGQTVGLIATVLAAQATWFMGWRVLYLLRYIKGRGRA